MGAALTRSTALEVDDLTEIRVVSSYLHPLGAHPPSTNFKN